MGALFSEYSELVREGFRYALIGVLGLVGLDSVDHGLAKLAKGPANLGGGMIEGLSLPFPTFFGVVVMLVELRRHHAPHWSSVGGNAPKGVEGESLIAATLC